MRFILFGLLILTLLHSTTITGQIVDGDTLKPTNNIIITLETQSGQLVMQKIFDAEYSIEIPDGEYLLRAYRYVNNSLDSYAQYQLKTTGQNTQLDVILIPYELQKLTPGFNPPPTANINNSTNQIDLTLIAIIILLSAGLRYFINKRDTQKTSDVETTSKFEPKTTEPEEKPELDEDCKKIIKILTENEGRMTQKEIREILNFSETKMSFVVTELETIGLVKRIKKGRENILKLAK